VRLYKWYDYGMRCLFLNIASHDGVVACVDDHAVLSLQDLSTRVRDHELLALTEQCLESAGWDYENLTAVACAIGPGGFTSLRIVVAYANTLVHQLRILGVGIHLSDLYRARLEVSDAVWLHATKRDALFVRGFGALAALWPQPVLLSIEETMHSIPQGTQWAGELLEQQQEVLSSLALRKAPLLPLPNVLPTFLNTLPMRTELLQPWYGRTW